jgi:hypothetical protein
MGYPRDDPPGPSDSWPRGTVYPLSGSDGNQYGAIPARGTGGTRITGGFLGQHLSKIIVAVVIALLTGGTSPWWWPWGSSAKPASGRPQDSVTVAAHDPGGNGGPGAGDVSATGATNGNGRAATSPAGGHGCTIVISNPFAAITDKPDPVDPGGTKIPPGSYSVLATTHTSFAGRSFLWFKITASGHTGWIQDDTILIDSKSAQCP